MARSKVGTVVLVAVVLQVLGLVANTVVALLTDWSGSAGWFAGPVVTVVIGAAVALFGKYAEDRTEPGAAPAGRRAGRRRSGTIAGALVALAVVVLVGVAAVVGVRYAVGFVTGDERGTSVLVEQADGRGAGISLTVQDVQYTEHFTRATVLVVNEGGTSASLPEFGNCVLVGADGTTLQADAFRSDWAPTVGPGGRQRGTLVFPGRLPDGVTGASLSFATVFRQGPGSGPATVQDIALDPARLPGG